MRAENSSMRPDCLVVISYYSARSVDPLRALLKQISTIAAGATFDVMVVVNRMAADEAALPALPLKCEILYRENCGYNIGAWQHGWLKETNYRYYLFLQDECAIERPNWLAAFIRRADAGYDVVGESLIISPGERNQSPDFPEQLRSVMLEQGLNETGDLTHIQTTIVFATGKALERATGFIEPSNEKIQAIACEVAFSVRMRHFGFRIGQVAFLPFEYISHPQWVELRARMRTPIGRIRRVVRMSLRH